MSFDTERFQATATIGPASSYECYSPNACYEIPLDANVSNTQWQMISHPSRPSKNIDQVTFLTTATGSDCLILLCHITPEPLEKV